MDKYELKNLLRRRMGLATIEYVRPEAPTESIGLNVPRRADPVKQVLSGIEGRVGATAIKVLAILVMVGGSVAMVNMFYSPYAVVYAEGVFPALFNVVYSAPFLWLSSRLVVGARKGGLMFATWIGLVSMIVQVVSGMFLEYSYMLVLVLVSYVALVRYYYDTSWRKSLIVSLYSGILVGLVMFFAVFASEL